MGGASSKKQRKSLEDYYQPNRENYYQPDREEMEGVQSLDSVHQYHTQKLNIKANINLVTNEKEVEEEGDQDNLKVDAQSKAEEKVTAAVGYQPGIFSQYDWREHYGWKSENFSGNEKQENFIRPWQVQRQCVPVQFQKL